MVGKACEVLSQLEAEQCLFNLLYDLVCGADIQENKHQGTVTVHVKQRRCRTQMSRPLATAETREGLRDHAVLARCQSCSSGQEGGKVSYIM